MILTVCTGSSAPGADRQDILSLASKKMPSERRVPRPRQSSLEYRLSWGLGAIRADRAYAGGATGKGVTVAIVDTGVNGARQDVLTNLSPHSIDLVKKRVAGHANADHGQQVAGVLAGALDGSGTVGIAYRATILEIRADIDGSCERQCAVQGADLARGIDYALRHGARIIVVPLVGDNRLPSVEGALGRAAAAGAVIVAAAGNSAKPHPSWPARYAEDPALASSIIVAGASTVAGEVASWSNRAGVAMERYVSAPGENVVTDCDERYCRLVSGTSYSVAYVAGCLALLLERYPGLSPQQLAGLLLSSARDVGSRGSDPRTGRGILDVSRALRAARQLSAHNSG
jgi:subtilisin family serine protease